MTPPCSNSQRPSPASSPSASASISGGFLDGAGASLEDEVVGQLRAPREFANASDAVLVAGVKLDRVLDPPRHHDRHAFWSKIASRPPRGDTATSGEEAVAVNKRADLVARRSLAVAELRAVERLDHLGEAHPRHGLVEVDVSRP